VLGLVQIIRRGIDQLVLRPKTGRKFCMGVVSAIRERQAYFALGGSCVHLSEFAFIFMDAKFYVDILCRHAPEINRML